MKRGDVFTQILSEVTGKPKESLADLLEAFKATIPGQHKFDEEIPDTEAKELLENLRKEKSGILSWLVRGYGQFVLRNFPPAGSA